MQQIEFSLKNGGRILVETSDTSLGRQPASRGGGSVAKKSKATFEEAAAGITPIAQAILERVKEASPDQVTVEFGVKLGVEAGVILTSTKGEAHCKITLTWKKD